MAHFGFVVDDQRRADVGAFENLGVFGNPYAFFGIVELVSRQCWPQLQDKFLDMGERFPWILEAFE